MEVSGHPEWVVDAELPDNILVRFSYDGGGYEEFWTDAHELPYHINGYER